MSGTLSNNNSTVNNSLTIDCGVRNYCYSPQACFASPEGPICDNINSNITTYSWKLNSTVFPPIEYVGTKFGRKSRDHCEIFNYTSWSDENKSWLLSYFYKYWNGNNTNIVPPGSFIKPLDYIGSCGNIVISSTDISLQQLYCDPNNLRCRRRINTTRINCVSSNQCLSQLCGFIPITQPTDGNVTVTNTTCVNDGFVTYDQLRGGRAFNVIPGDEINSEGNKNNNNNDGTSGNSSGSMVIIIIILVILFASMAIYGYARKIFKKNNNNDDETHYLRREIDPETGEIVTVSTAAGGLRRGTSILRNSINRSNSIRTLPPYSVVDEERPISTSGGIVNSITQFFFPPGELPPPYDSIEGNIDESNNINITLDEVREGVTIEGNGNGNGNNGNGNGGDGDGGAW